jgi:outer membrane receptor protein involved in Fe transport
MSVRVLVLRLVGLAFLLPLSQVCAQAATDPVAAAAGDAAPPAQPASPQSASTLGEVVVTAQKRKQKVDDIGMTITPVSAGQLESLGITDVSQLSAVVSGFSGAETYTGYPVFSLRGINFNAAQISAPPAVSVSIDEAPLPYSQMAAGMMFDLDRVEVLKGPQGTLYGQNATGGSINLIAARPTRDFSAGAGAEVNNFGQTMLNGYISGPLDDKLGARFAATTTQMGAWQKGYYLNDGKNGDQNEFSARGILDWKPLDRLKVSLQLDGHFDHGEVQQPQLSAVTPVNPAGAAPGLIGYPPPGNDRDVGIPSGFDTHASNQMYQAVVRADYTVNDDLTFTSLSDYIHTEYSAPINLTGTAIPIIQYLSWGNIGSINQEFRLTGKVADYGIHYIVGANYQHDLITDAENGTFIAYSGLPPGAGLDAIYNLTNRAAAAFANIDYDLSRQLSFTAGLRYTNTRQWMDGCTFDGGNGASAAALGGIANAERQAAGLPATDAYVPGGCITINNTGASPDYLPIRANVSQNQSNVAWRGGVNYKPVKSTLLYGLVSRGYKSGIFPVQNTIVDTQIQPVKQEQLTDYEAGIKSALFGRRLHLDAAVFYYDYRDKQFYTYVPTPVVGATSTLVNIPKSTVKGLDFDFTAIPFEGVTVRGGLTYIDARVGAYQSYNLNEQPEDFDGKQFNFSPPLSATLDAQYEVPVRDQLLAYFGGGALYNSATYADLGESPFTRLPPYVIANLRAGVECTARRHWSVGFFVRNLTDKYYWTSVGPAGDVYNRFAGMPRTFGLTASIGM